MGLAPFFDRARQGAAQVLRGFDADAFERRLDETVVTLAFDGDAARSGEGAASLDMVARLVARLYPRVHVRSLDGYGPMADSLAALMRTINPAIDIMASADGKAEFAIVAGRTPYGCPCPIHMGSDGWVARVSASGPLNSGDTGNPFGAGAAACVAVANLFRAVFAAWLHKPALDADARLSLLNFEVGAKAANADLPGSLDIGLVQLVGLGAIGNGCVWALSRLPHHVAGILDLVDHETVELSNMQRYVLTRMGDVGRSKVEMAAAAFGGGIRPVLHGGTWADYVARQGHRHDRVAVALDTARDRVQVQGSLPRSIVNAWTQAGDLGISRHGFGGEDACLACLYLPDGKRRNEDEIVAEELGFRSEQGLRRVRDMLHLGFPVDEQFVRDVADGTGIDADALLPFVGLPLRAFRQRAICGNAILRAKDAGGADLEVPMAFQSALAGIMLAAELVASIPGLGRRPPATRSTLDLMRAVPTSLNSPMLRGRPGPARCICEDDDYVATYRTKYGVPAPGQ